MIDPFVTIGFESEWANHLTPMLVRLHADGHIPDPELHSYHCDCEHCAEMEDYDLKAQRDSSCAGELISSCFSITMWDRITDILSSLEQAAYDTDAEPGIHAGFHVHARHQNLYLRRDTPDERSFETFIGTLMFYPVLQLLGNGRHLGYGFNNVPTIDIINGALDYIDPNKSNIDCLVQWAQWYRDEGYHTEQQANAWHNITGADRHSYINWRTRYDTIEFRLFRSTRMAWRMELYILLAALTVSPNFSSHVVDYIINTPMTDDDWLDGTWGMSLIRELPTLPNAPLNTARRIAHLQELCNVQYDYITNTPNVPATFTI